MKWCMLKQHVLCLGMVFSQLISLETSKNLIQYELKALFSLIVENNVNTKTFKGITIRCAINSPLAMLKWNELLFQKAIKK